MSKFLTFPDVTFKDRRLLVAALVDLGCTGIDQGVALPLYGYRRNQRPETAEIVIRRRYICSLSNDLGFARTPGGHMALLARYMSRWPAVVVTVPAMISC